MNSPDINYKGCQALSVLSIIRAAFEFISIALSVYLLISSYISLSSIEYIYIFSIIGSALALARFILISKLSTGWKKDVIYIKTAHLRDYNDGYDIHSIFNIDNIPEPVQYESPGELSIPSWDVIDESVPAEQPQNITPTTAPATDITENNTNKSNAVQCPSCHSLMTTEDKFCTNCGQKLI